MCGRFTLHTEKEILGRRFEVSLDDWVGEPRFNIAPTQSVLTVRESDERRIAETMRWGLVPGWARDRTKLPPMINARAETLAEKPAYRDSFRRRRCLIPADGFYEWQKPVGLGKSKIPHWISLTDGEPFAMAGLWAEWRPPSGLDEQVLRSCTIVTTAARPSIGPIHERMPLILPPATEAAWLDPSLEDAEALAALLVPVEDTRLAARSVSKRVNSPRNDGPELIAPWEDPSLGF